MLVVLLALGCTQDLEADRLRPSLTMFRTGEADPADYEEEVVLPDDLYIPGILQGPVDFDYPEGDLFRYRTADTVLTDLSAMIDLEDPAVLDEHVGTYDYSRIAGALTRGDDDIDWLDVQQGAIGDCYLAAALTAVLYADTDRLARDGLIRPLVDANGDTTHFAVRFYDAWGRPQDVHVDVDVVRRSGKPLYARSGDSRSDGEEWAISLIEKAYAEWHGGYQRIGDGGWPGDVMQAISGSKATFRSIAYLSDASLVQGITDAVADSRPVVASTFGEDDGVDYTGSGVYAWHAYSVHGAPEVDGEQYIELRNPWGSSEPSPDGLDGVDDGRFLMKIADFRRLYSGITYGGGFSDDVTAPDAPDDLALVEQVGDKAILRFTATGDDGERGLAARYDVRVSSEPFGTDDFYAAEALDIASPQVPGTEESFEVAVSGTVYVALRVEDESGNLSPVSDVVEISAGGAPGPAEIAFSFEDGAPGWEATGLWHLSTLDAASGSTAYWFGDEDSVSYDVGSRPEGALTSPVLDLSGYDSPVLYWEHLLDVESGSDYDLAVVEVASESGGYADWAEVWTKGSPSGTWELRQADLAAFAGSSVRARWRFDAVDDEENARIGWLVDDVTVLEQ